MHKRTNEMHSQVEPTVEEEFWQILDRSSRLIAAQGEPVRKEAVSFLKLEEESSKSNETFI